MYRLFPLLLLIPIKSFSQSLDSLGLGFPNAIFSPTHSNGVGDFGVQLGNLYNNSNETTIKAGAFPFSSGDSISAYGWSTASLNHFIIQYNPLLPSNQLTIGFEVDDQSYELQTTLSSTPCITAAQLGINNIENALYSINNLTLNSESLISNPLILTPDTSSFYKIAGIDISKGFTLEMDVVINQSLAPNRAKAAITISLGTDQSDELPLNDSNTNLVATRSDGGSVLAFCEGQALTYTASGGSLYRFFTYTDIDESGQPINQNYVGDFSTNDVLNTNSLSNGQQIGVDILDGICTHQKLLSFTPVVYPLPDSLNLSTEELSICVPQSDIESRSWVLPPLNAEEIYIFEPVSLPQASRLEINTEYFPDFTQAGELSINSDGSIIEWNINPTNTDGQAIYGTYSFRVLVENQTTLCRSAWTSPYYIHLLEKPNLLVPQDPPKVCSDQPLFGTFSEATLPLYMNSSPFSSWNFISQVVPAGLQPNPSNINIEAPLTNQESFIINSDQFTNSTHQNITVQYEISANSNNGCTSENVTVSYDILAQPEISNLSDTSIQSGQLLEKTLELQTNFEPDYQFTLSDLDYSNQLIPDSFNTKIGETYNQNLIFNDQWFNTNLRSQDVTYSINATNSEIAGGCPATEKSFQLTVVPQPNLNWQEVITNQINPNDTIIFCADNLNQNIQYFLKPSVRIRDGEELFLVQTGISIDDPDNIGLNSSQYSAQSDTIKVTDPTFHSELIQDQFTIAQPQQIGKAFLTYQWKIILKTQEGSNFESPSIPITYGVANTELAILTTSISPVDNKNNICQNKAIELEISVADDGLFTMGSDYNLILAGVYHSLDSASGNWTAGYGPITGSENYTSNQNLNNSSAISEVLAHQLNQTVWIKYDITTIPTNSLVQCNGPTTSRIVSIAPNLKAELQWTTDTPNASNISVSAMPFSLNLNFISQVALSLREKLKVKLLGLTQTGGSFIDNSSNGTAILTDTLLKDTNQHYQLNANQILQLSDRLLLSNPNLFFQPASIGYRLAYEWDDQIACPADTIQQVFTILPEPALDVLDTEGTVTTTPFQVCSGSEVTFQLTYQEDYTNLSSTYYQLVLTDIAYSEGNAAGTWRTGYGPVQVSNPIPKGSTVNLNQNYNQSLSHNANKTYWIRYTFTNFMEGFNSLKNVGSTSIVIQVNPNPSFMETYENLTKTTSADGVGNCFASFSWNHPKIFGGTGSEELTLTINGTNTTTVTPGAVYLNDFGPGQHHISYQVESLCGNAENISFTVTVEDNEAPSISCSNDININLGVGQIFAEVQYTIPKVTDNCQDTELLRIRGPLPGDLFPEGTYPTTFLGFDKVGRIAICHFEVNVLPTSATPPLSCEESSITVELKADECSIPVDFTPPICDGDCEGANLQKISNFSSGQEFPVGTHIVNYQLQHRSGLTVDCAVNINIAPPQPRIFNCNAPTFTIPYGTTYSLKLSDFIQSELLADACGNPVHSILISQTEIDCEEVFSNRNIQIEWTNGMGQKENCTTSISVERTGESDLPNWSTLFSNEIKKDFIEDPCNPSVSYQLAVTCEIYSKPASGLAYTEWCSGTFLEVSVQEITNFGRGGLQLRANSESNAPVFSVFLEKSFEGIRLVQKIKATLDRKDGKGEQILWEQEGQLPLGLKIGFLNGKVLAYHNQDGTNWNLITERSFTDQNCIIGGLYVLSKHTRQEVKVNFTQVSWSFNSSNNNSKWRLQPNYPSGWQPFLYPNPTKGMVTIKGNFALQEIQIISLSGHQLFQKSYSLSERVQEEKIATTHFKSGVFLVRLKDWRGQISIQKLVVQ